MEQSQSQQKQLTDYDKARQALRIMQAALDKAKSTHGDLYTFGDCASVYAAMMSINTFIDKNEHFQQNINNTNVNSSNSLPQTNIPQKPVVSYQTN